MATEGKNLSDVQNIPSGKGKTIAVLTAEWNAIITDNLKQGCLETLEQSGASVLSLSVPGSFELPQAANLLAQQKKVDAIVCLGSVIRGETAHFDFVCQAAAIGIQEASIKNNIPVVFGVLTDDNLQQAKDRSGGKHGNKGIEAAVTALKMIAFSDRL